MGRKLLFALSVVLGLAALAAIPFLVGVDKVLAALAKLSTTGLAAFVGVAALTIVMPAIGWWIIMRGEGIEVSLGRTIAANWMGFPVNLLTPSAYLGGEPVKTIYIARATGVLKRRVLATIIVAKVQEISALGAMMVVCLVLYLLRQSLPPAAAAGLWTVTGGIVLAVTFSMIAFHRNAQPTVRIIELLARWGIARRRMARLRSKAIEMEDLIHQAFNRRWKRFLVAQAVTSVSAVAIFLRPWVWAVFDSEVGPLGSEHMAAIYLVTNAINTVAFTPGGIGLFEGGVLGYFSASGLGEQNGVLYSIVNRLSDVTFVMVGLWLLVHAGLTGVARRAATEGAVEDAGGEPPAEGTSVTGEVHVDR